MAATKPEVTISQLVDQLATKVQRLTYVSRVQHSNGAKDNTVRLSGSAKSKMAHTKTIDFRHFIKFIIVIYQSYQSLNMKN